MGKMKLSGKLSGSFGLMGLMLLIGGMVGTFGILQVSGKLHNISEINHSATYHIGVISENQIKIQRISKSLLVPEIFNNLSEKDKQIKSIEESWSRAEDSWRAFDLLPRTDEVDVAWKNLKPAWETWQKAEQDFLRLVKEGKREDALGVMNTQLEASFGTSRKLMLDLSDVNVKLAREAGRAGMTEAGWLKMIALVGTIFGIMIAVCLGFYLARSIARPVRKVIANLIETSEQFAEAARQIAQSSSHLAEGTSVQASAVEEAFSVINALVSDNQVHNDQVQKLKRKTTEIDGFRDESHDNVKWTAVAMKDIKASSEETSGILKTIEKIAFQTNLLALNASVEAARAGEVGAGFAVVAEEVRNLAIRSADAAKNTTELISGTVKAIYEGGELVEATLSKFNEYTEVAAKFVSVLDNAVGLCGQLPPKFQQIKNAVEEISNVVQGNAASAEEAAAAAEEMTAQCEAMNQYIRELSAVVGEAQESMFERLSLSKKGRLELPPPGVSAELASPGKDLIEDVR
jgi:methyl-accepting chemotaxis protein